MVNLNKNTLVLCGKELFVTNLKGLVKQIYLIRQSDGSYYLDIDPELVPEARKLLNCENIKDNGSVDPVDLVQFADVTFWEEYDTCYVIRIFDSVVADMTKNGNLVMEYLNVELQAALEPHIERFKLEGEADHKIDFLMAPHFELANDNNCADLTKEVDITFNCTYACDLGNRGSVYERTYPVKYLPHITCDKPYALITVGGITTLVCLLDGWIIFPASVAERESVFVSISYTGLRNEVMNYLEHH